MSNCGATFSHASQWLTPQLDRTMAETIALIVAAGRGERAQRGLSAPPKQYRLLAGKPVLRWAVEAFLGHPAISAVRVVIRGEDRADYESATSGLTLETPVVGGGTRQ